MMNRNRRTFAWVGVVLLAALPLLAACESKQQREEIAKLTGEVQTLTQEKSDLQSQLDASQQEQAKLKAQVDELTKKLADTEAKLAEASKPKAKAPAAKKTTKK